MRPKKTVPSFFVLSMAHLRYASIADQSTSGVTSSPLMDPVALPLATAASEGKPRGHIISVSATPGHYCSAYAIL